MKEEFDALFAEHQKLLGELQAIRNVKRTWVGLTDEDISEIVRGTHNTGSFVRAIEAKLKEKNNGIKE
jgi:hypothetical protein